MGGREVPDHEARIIIDSCVFVDAFDPNSANHDTSLRLLETLCQQKKIVTMPASGWFEVQCSLQKLIEEKRYDGPRIDGEMSYPVALVHIDDKFIKKYSMLAIPHIKAGDHIFIALSMKGGYTLVTSDAQMTKVAKECAVEVYSPGEFMERLD